MKKITMNRFRNKISIIIAALFIVGVSISTFLYCRFFYEKSRHFIVEEFENDIVFGNENAPLSVYMFANYDCSYCRFFLQNELPLIDSLFIQKGKLKLILKLVNFTHEYYSERASKAAICFNQYSDYQKLNSLFLIQPEIIYSREFDTLIESYINKNEGFAECFYSGIAENSLLQNKNLFYNLKLDKLPTFIINNKTVVGFKEADKFIRLIEKELHE